MIRETQIYVTIMCYFSIIFEQMVWMNCTDEGTNPTVKSLLASNLVHKVDPYEVWKTSKG